VVDVEVVQLTGLVKLLVDGDTLTAVERSFRDGLVRFAARVTASDHGPVTEADIMFGRHRHTAAASR
jgi:hypothetical protein